MLLDWLLVADVISLCVTGRVQKHVLFMPEKQHNTALWQVRRLMSLRSRGLEAGFIVFVSVLLPMRRIIVVIVVGSGELLVLELRECHIWANSIVVVILEVVVGMGAVRGCCANAMRVQNLV